MSFKIKVAIFKKGFYSKYIVLFFWFDKFIMKIFLVAQSMKGIYPNYAKPKGITYFLNRETGIIYSMFIFFIFFLSIINFYVH